MTTIREIKKALMDALDPMDHALAVRALKRCRGRADLDALVDTWLTPEGVTRLKLIRHGVGTYMIVRYEDGWTSRLGMAVWRDR